MAGAVPIRVRSGCVTWAAGVALTVLGLGCSTAQARIIQILQLPDACAPGSFDVRPGERVHLDVRNETTSVGAFEGLDNRFQQLVVPAGQTRSADWSAPRNVGSARFRCTRLGGPETIVMAVVAR